MREWGVKKPKEVKVMSTFKALILFCGRAERRVMELPEDVGSLLEVLEQLARNGSCGVIPLTPPSENLLRTIQAGEQVVSKDVLLLLHDILIASIIRFGPENVLNLIR